MALMRIDHVPETVRVNLSLNIILPEPRQLRETPLRKRKVLYLLHGLSDDAGAWQRYTTIETVARHYGLVVVMPSVGRSFYTDQPNGQRYFTYLTQELPRYLHDVFGLALKRDDTLIAGVSMGGYGAIKAALAFPQRFCAAASLSGVLSLEILHTHSGDPRQVEFSHIFGDLAKLAGSEHDPETWVKTAAKSGKRLPRLYVTSGRQEDLYPLGLNFVSICQANDIAVQYHEEDGRHEWPFWDLQIRRFLKLELEPNQPE
jgi:S-formylglutathione hydrolase FrmB